MLSRNKARELRRNSTEAEKKLWSILRSRQLSGWKFRRQVPIGPYIVDFICHEAHLVIEADGGQHAECKSDASRDEWLKREGFWILRLWNNDILTNEEGVARVVLATLDPLTPTPLPQGERGLADGVSLG
ncbi:MAG: endonuclease domain-containing protein [Sphingobium sp.]|nr:endonuclease domain-containing protein [Sphingobium sp.]